MSDLTRTEIIDILLNEMECVQRAADGECDRDCAKCDLLRNTDQILQAYRIAIRALEHPEENVVKIIPHGDTVSRQAVQEAITLSIELKENPHQIWKRIQNLPSAEKTEDEILKMQELEQAEIQKAYELGKAEKTGHWIAIDEEPHEDYECDQCGKIVSTWCEYINPSDEYKFCPNCGAKMGVSE